MERSFTEDVKQLGYGAGQTLHGEGILAITKALLQSGVSYVGGYPGAPVSHLLDVMADANEPLLRPMGIYFEQSGSEAAAAALLGASINYPMRGAVEIGRRHQRRLGRAVARGLGRRRGRGVDRDRRGLRRGRVDPAGADALGRAQVERAAARPAQ